MSKSFDQRRKEFDRDFERHARFAKRALIAGWLISLALLGVFVWIAIRVTLHFT